MCTIAFSRLTATVRGPISILVSLLHNTASSQRSSFFELTCCFWHPQTIATFYHSLNLLFMLRVYLSWAHFISKLSGHDFNLSFTWFDTALIGRWRLAPRLSILFVLLHTSRDLYPVSWFKQLLLVVLVLVCWLLNFHWRMILSTSFTFSILYFEELFYCYWFYCS